MKMTITRARLKANFTIVPNELITDLRISPEARMLQIYFLSKPETWSVWRTDLMKILTCGKRRYDRIMAELRDYGYVETKRGGESGGTTIIVHQVSESAVLAPSERKCQNATVAKKHHIVSTDLLVSTDSVVVVGGREEFMRLVAEHDATEECKEWLVVLKKKKSTMSKAAWSRRLSTLMTLIQEKNDLKKVFIKSSECGWVGLFGEKENGKTRQNSERSAPRKGTAAYSDWLESKTLEEIRRTRSGCPA